MALSVGLIGCGYWGSKWLRVIRQVPGYAVKAICDANPHRLAALRRQTEVGTVLTTAADAILADPAIAAVIIATPAATHGTLAVAALTAGKHVLVEKPLTLDPAAAETLVKLAADSARVLMVDHTFLYHPSVQALAQSVRTGALGPIWHVHAERSNLGPFRSDASVLWDQALHDLTIMEAVLGSAPLTVAAVGKSCLPGYPEAVAHLTLTYPGDILAHVAVSWAAPTRVRRMVVAGRDGMAVYDDTDTELPVRIFDRLAACDGPGGPVQYRRGGAAALAAPATEPLAAAAAHFRDCVQQGLTPVTDGRAGLRVVQALAAAERSLRLGGVPQPIPGGPEDQD